MRHHHQDTCRYLIIMTDLNNYGKRKNIMKTRLNNMAQAIEITDDVEENLIENMIIDDSKHQHHYNSEGDWRKYSKKKNELKEPLNMER